MSDDLHWADDATLGLIGYLARRTLSSALGLLCTTRSVEPKSRQVRLLQALAREDKLARIVLPPLATVELACAAEAWSGSPVHWLADWVVDTVEGNPFFATELLHFAKANDWLAARTPPATTGPAAVIPGSIRALIASRIERLSEPAQRVLAIAAVVGREFSFDLIVQVSQLDEISALDACDELRAAALVQPTGDEHFRFDHTVGSPWRNSASSAPMCSGSSARSSRPSPWAGSCSPWCGRTNAPSTCRCISCSTISWRTTCTWPATRRR